MAAGPADRAFPPAGWAVNATFDEDGARSLLLARWAPRPPAEAPGWPVCRVAGFDLNDTLVRSTRGAPGYRLTLADMAPLAVTVVPKLRELAAGGYVLSVFSNQGNIRSAAGGARAAAVRAYVDAFLQEVGAPIHVFLAPQRDRMRKPETGMWDALESAIRAAGGSVSREESFFVGDAAGGPGEHSADDRDFARALGVRFFHAQSYFAAPPPRSGEARFLSVPEELGDRAPEPRAPRQVLLVLVGLPGSGKTTAALQMANWGPPGSWVRVSQDQLRSRARCLRLAASALGASSSVVVDRTNLTAEQRAWWVTLAAEQRVPCHCVEFLVSLEVCAERAAQRSEHEGGVTGARGRRATMVAAAGRQPVESAEGFAAYAAVGGAPGDPGADRVLHALYGGASALPATPRGAAGALPSPP